MGISKPSELEMQVLSVLWQNGPRTARQVLESMPDGKKRAYTTILSVLQVMEKKGLLKHTSRGTAHVFEPTVTEDQALRPLLSQMVKNFFGGNRTAALQMLLDQKVSKDELDEIRQLLQGLE